MYIVFKYLAKSLLVFGLFVLSVTLMGLFLSLQSSPIVTGSANLDNYSAQQSQQLAKRLWQDIHQPNSYISLRVSKSELEGLTALLHRAIPNINTSIQLSSVGGRFSSTLTLPLPSLVKYLNISLLVLPSKKGLEVDHITIGGLSLSGEWLIPIFKWIVNNFIQPNLGDVLVDMITTVSISSNDLRVNAHINKGVMAFKQQGSLIRKLRDELSLFGDTQNIHCYFNALNVFAQRQDKDSSIAVYIAHLFKLAKSGCLANKNQSPKQENESALLALVLYFGADNFQLIITDVLNIPKPQLVARNRLRSNVSLQGRADLQQHFIYSIALQLFSNYQASDAIGEFKEFLDSNSGGSGFSFADLMADRAGTRLAMIATHSDEQAKKAQNLLMFIEDKQLLPEINGLEEGLDKTAFKKQFKNINSDAYRQTLKSIDIRLKTLAVYQLAWH